MELKLNGAGAVDFIFLTNGTRVKNQMTVSEAKGLINSGSIKRDGNQIIVDDKFIFTLDGEEEPKEEVKEEPKKEPKKKLAEEIKEDKPLKEVVKERKPRKKAKK